MDFIPDEHKHTLLSQFRTKEAEGITDVEEAMRSICVDMGMPEDDARATELRASQPQICVASIPTDRLEACVRAFGALHAAAPWRTTNFDTKVEAVIAGRRYFIACDGGDGEKPTLAIYASYADAQPRNEAKQHDSYLVTFGGFFARREAQPPPETDREVCEFILGAGAFDGGRAYPECTKLVAKPRRRVDTPLGPDEVGLCAAAARVYVAGARRVRPHPGRGGHAFLFASGALDADACVADDGAILWRYLARHGPGPVLPVRRAGDGSVHEVQGGRLLQSRASKRRGRRPQDGVWPLHAAHTGRRRGRRGRARRAAVRVDARDARAVRVALWVPRRARPARTRPLELAVRLRRDAVPQRRGAAGWRGRHVVRGRLRAARAGAAADARCERHAARRRGLVGRVAHRAQRAARLASGARPAQRPHDVPRAHARARRRVARARRRARDRRRARGRAARRLRRALAARAAVGRRRHARLRRSGRPRPARRRGRRVGRWRLCGDGAARPRAVRTLHRRRPRRRPSPSASTPASHARNTAGPRRSSSSPSDAYRRSSPTTCARVASRAS